MQKGHLNYLVKSEKLLNSDLKNYCISSNYDENLLSIIPNLSSGQLITLLSQYPDSNYTDTKKLIKTKFKTNNVVLGIGSEDLIIRCNNLINKRKLKTAIVYPAFYRIYETIPSKSYIKINEEKLFSQKLNGIDIVWICNPNPLTGEVISKNKLLKLFRDNPDVLFIIDEAMIFPLDRWMDYTLLDKCENLGNFVVLESLSKMYGLSGMRAGFASGNKKFLVDIENCGVTFAFTSLTKFLTEHFLDKEEFFQDVRKRIHKNKHEIEEVIRKNKLFEIKENLTNCIYFRRIDRKSLYEDLLNIGVIGLDIKSEDNTNKDGLVRITAHSSSELHTYLLSKINLLCRRNNES